MIKKVIKILVIVVVVAFVVIQFFRIDRSVPPIDASQTLEAAVNVPPEVSMILGRSCSDCHSYTTIYPWYAQVQPVAWFLKDHIDDGRREVNFSIFNTYTPKRKAKKFEEICEQVERGEMPLPSYLWIHWDAKLKEGDAKVLCDWANEEKAKIAAE